jgi:hypothetical protein
MELEVPTSLFMMFFQKLEESTSNSNNLKYNKSTMTSDLPTTHEFILQTKVNKMNETMFKDSKNEKRK